MANMHISDLPHSAQVVMEKLLTEEWTAADWQDFHEAVESAKWKIAIRHAKQHFEELGIGKKKATT